MKLYSAYIPSLFKSIFRKNRKVSYAQAGEDLILNALLSDKKKGFYIDIGANNPLEQSNTHLFYKKGWNGINIDALPGSMKVFNRVRSRDINLEIPVSNSGETLKYFMFSPSFYNSFSPEQVEKYKNILIGERQIKTERLCDILDKFAGKNEIDFMSVDVEGMDLDVLKSNNWLKYRPNIIVSEYITFESDLISKTPIGKYLSEIGYTSFCNTPMNAFFLENNFFKTRFK